MAQAALCDVRLRFRDGVERMLRVAPGETILEAALAQDVPLLFQCRSGSCATCIASLTQGVAEMRRGAATVPDGRGRGLRLCARL